MKASQLRAASALIENLDCIMQDLEVLNKIDCATVIVKFQNVQGKLKPLKTQYREFLLARKTAVEQLLQKMGVEIDK